MKIGVSKFITDRTVDITTWARKAEELGFDSIWLPEHAAIPVHSTTPQPAGGGFGAPENYAHIADPFVTLARASAVTSTIKLATAICIVPEHHPVVLAKTVASLDYFSGGRFLFGVGSGWLREEQEMFPISFKNRVRYMRESILAMKELWTKEEAEFHGELVDFPLVRCYPKPVQKPHPPVLLGSMARNVLQRVVAWADGWIPPPRITVDQIRDARRELDRLAREAGRDPASIEISVFCGNAPLELMKEYEAAGASRLMRGTRRDPEAEALAELEEIASEVLNK